ncbi:nucleotidyltransferase family protein [Brevibacillus choshinensis]|uniref:Nucleotidyltransferase family protein n=1 Tax=Brevibacillus choshinensis TaxID=54911 RepID=A0ABX7FSQ5_BRECH|nr:nucleotidyltransferase family protein [Brevibacillus choshinensis]QRG67990.1 nucleotidyltransferase family protein [Brevibacillus choshinensis]
MLRVGAIVLAAGQSRRMGSAKQFLPLRGKPLFRHAVERAAACQLSPILLIGGEHSERLRQLTRDLPEVEVLDNREYATGMASSLRRGMEAVAGRVDAVLVFLADQPYVPDQVVQSLIQTYADHRAEGVKIVRPIYQNTAGHPVLFDAALLGEFTCVTGDQGGKDIIDKYKSHLKKVRFARADWNLDIDTPDDYCRVQQAILAEPCE